MLPGTLSSQIFARQNWSTYTKRKIAKPSFILLFFIATFFLFRYKIIYTINNTLYRNYNTILETKFSNEQYWIRIIVLQSRVAQEAGSILGFTTKKQLEKKKNIKNNDLMTDLFQQKVVNLSTIWLAFLVELYLKVFSLSID